MISHLDFLFTEDEGVERLLIRETKDGHLDFAVANRPIGLAIKSQMTSNNIIVIQCYGELRSNPAHVLVNFGFYFYLTTWSDLKKRPAPGMHYYIFMLLRSYLRLYIEFMPPRILPQSWNRSLETCITSF